LRLGGYVAFDLPRTTTALGGLLLSGLVTTHIYVVLTQMTVPAYFLAYCAVLIVGCLLAAGAMWTHGFPSRLGWFLGSLVCVLFVATYAISRVASVAGLVAVTGRWDFAPGTLALAFACGFVLLHMSVLLGINVAYPRRRLWRD
jgi:hypothetical protein